MGRGAEISPAVQRNLQLLCRRCHSRAFFLAAVHFRAASLCKHLRRRRDSLGSWLIDASMFIRSSREGNGKGCIFGMKTASIFLEQVIFRFDFQIFPGSWGCRGPSTSPTFTSIILLCILPLAFGYQVVFHLPSSLKGADPTSLPDSPGRFVQARLGRLTRGLPSQPWFLASRLGFEAVELSENVS